jgi:D-aminoacyl-tRNA deacylase
VRAVVQRVARARVTPGGAIGPGLGILLGVAVSDDETAAVRLARKVARLRIFDDAEGKLATSILDTGGEALVVSQFTLIADGKGQGTRPDFSGAASKKIAEPLYERFCAELRALGVPTSTGVFGGRMTLEVVNEGPVTIVLDG